MSATFPSSTGSVALGSLRNHKHSTAQITGSIPAAMIPNLGASKFTGSLAVANVPVSSMGSKITTGTLTDAQLFNSNAGARVDASKITTGSVNIARLRGSIPLDQWGGLITSQATGLINTGMKNHGGWHGVGAYILFRYDGVSQHGGDGNNHAGESLHHPASILLNTSTNNQWSEPFANGSYTKWSVPGTFRVMGWKGYTDRWTVTLFQRIA